jgi:hypothetical protein
MRTVVTALFIREWAALSASRVVWIFAGACLLAGFGLVLGADEADSAVWMALPLLLYWLTLPRSLTLGDAGLFQLVCHEGGVGLPPGYPLFTLACQGLSHFRGSTIR